MRRAMEVALSQESEDVRRRVRSTATVVDARAGASAGAGADGSRDGEVKQGNDATVDPSRGNANQWADKEKNQVQFGYDADVEAEKWWAEHGQRAIGPLARM